MQMKNEYVSSTVCLSDLRTSLALGAVQSRVQRNFCFPICHPLIITLGSPRLRGRWRSLTCWTPPPLKLRTVLLLRTFVGKDPVTTAHPSSFSSATITSGHMQRCCRFSLTWIQIRRLICLWFYLPVISQALAYMLQNACSM